MNPQEYIESGILELYIYGKLSESEIEEVLTMASKYPEIKEKINTIENTVILFTSGITPELSSQNYYHIQQKLFEKAASEIPATNQIKSPSWKLWLSTIFLLLLTTGMIYFIYQYTHARTKLNELGSEFNKLKKESSILKKKNIENNTILTIMRDPNSQHIVLSGMEILPDAQAMIYWNKKTLAVYIDAFGLPVPPNGKIYQVWALKLNPITPSSIGLLEDFSSKSNLFFEINNVEEAEAFAITLEDNGGSSTPNLKEIYALGKIN